eukprot:TRINITY_DN8933_c0_g1_i2.p1 TRINITY_DN8933_c0_g1~~TRINITY_DN8933_c0_g1_i2.p1  ORF type:complete len:415 (+),score=60.17 TRINITY_DN8933_c0_g1_i2:70-1245(+)
MASNDELIERLNSVDEQAFVDIITSCLNSRPQLAFAICSFAIPDLTFAPTKAVNEKRYTGTLTSWNAKTDCGRIACPEVSAIFEDDIVIRSDQYAGQPLGSVLNFAVLLNRSRKPQAFDVSVVGGAPPAVFLQAPPPATNSSCPKQKPAAKPTAVRSREEAEADWHDGNMHKSARLDGAVHRQGYADDDASWASEGWADDREHRGHHKGGGRGAHHGAAAWEAPIPYRGLPEGLLGDQLYEGSVKKLDDRFMKWGFIACETVWAITGTDVFADGHLITTAGADVGDRVVFRIGCNERGQIQALEPLNLVAPRPGMQVKEEEPIVEEGTIKSFNVNKGYGFIYSENVYQQTGLDAFLPARIAKECTAQGMPVQFEFFINERGQPEASSVWAA